MRNTKLKSGRWKGYYVYGMSESGFQHTMQLDVTINEYIIIIKGKDDIGRFFCKGLLNYYLGKCFFFKRYETHEVYYNGKMTHKGIKGQWKIGNTTGLFEIWSDLSCDELSLEESRHMDKQIEESLNEITEITLELSLD